MIVKNLSPFAFATKVTSKKPPRPEMMLVVKGVFALAPGKPLEPLDRAESVPSGDRWREDDDDMVGETIAASDFADFKPSAEVLVIASFHAPHKRPVREAEVRVSVGKWRKVLRVVGPRVWIDDALGSAATEPAPFTEVPIRWSHAYGGEGFAGNPAGRGHTSKEVPQIELPGSPVRSRGEHNVAASFAPISPRWHSRTAKVGVRYGKEWQTSRSPFVSDDFDWTHHQAASPDQWLDGWLKGDEEISFENLHPDAPSFSAKLPGLRVRAFGRTQTGETRAVSMVLDTLVADLEKGTLALSWRGHMPSAEMDLRDIRSLLIASEPLGNARLEQEYAAMLDAFEADPVGLEAARAEMVAEMSEGIPTAEPAPRTDPVSKQLADKKFEGADVLAGHVAAGVASVMAVRAPGQDPVAKLEASIAAAAAADQDEPPIPMPIKPGELPSTGLRRRIRAIMTNVDRVRAELDGKPVSTEQRKELDDLARLPHDPSLPKLDPLYTVPEALSTHGPGPGADLVDHDLTGRDLRGLDLSGARLDGAVLTRAKLQGTNLRGASLRGAVLFKAEAAGAIFDEADLTRANLANLDARGASFRRAKLELAFAEDADLGGADFEEANVEWAAFTRAVLSGARAKRARFYRTDFADAKLDKADFAGASLRASVLSRVDASEIDLTGAEVRAVSAEGAKLRRAKLIRAHGERLYLTGADLDGADLSLAVLPSSHFIDATARGAELYGADLRGGRFDRIDLSDARLDAANLLSADLRAAKIDRAKFVGTNLYDAKLLEATGEGVDFSGANLERCVYTQRRAAEVPS